MNNLENNFCNEPGVRVNNGVDFKSICHLILNEWKLVVGTIFVFVVLGGMKAFSTVEMYRAKVHLLEPSPARVYKLKSTEMFSQISPDGLLNDLIRTFRSRSFALEFIKSSPNQDEAYGNGEDAVLLERFYKRFRIVEHFGKGAGNALFPYTLELSTTSREVSEKELKRLVDFASAQLIKAYSVQYSVFKDQHLKKLKNDYDFLQSKLKSEKSYAILQLEEERDKRVLKLSDELEISKERYLVYQNDKLVAFNNAYDIADSLKIVNPVNMSEVGGGKRTTVEFSVKKEEEPLYLMGSKLLRSEIALIEKRSLDYFPSPEVRTLEKSLALSKIDRELDALKARDSELPYNPNLQAIDFEMKKVDQAFFPENTTVEFMNSVPIAELRAIGISKGVLLVVSLLLGVIFGVGLVLVKWGLQGSVRSRYLG